MLRMDPARYPGPSEDWSEHNERQRGDTKTYALSNPCGSLVRLAFMEGLLHTMKFIVHCFSFSLPVVIFLVWTSLVFGVSFRVDKISGCECVVRQKV
jgi:hypothetical protein